MWNLKRLFDGNGTKGAGVQVEIHVREAGATEFVLWGDETLTTLPRVADSLISALEGTPQAILVVGVLHGRLGDRVAASLFCARLAASTDSTATPADLGHFDLFAGPARVASVPNPAPAGNPAASPCPPPAQRLDVAETPNVANAMTPNVETPKPLAAAGETPKP